MEKVCCTCKYHFPPDDGYMCACEHGEYYNWFRNDYKSCGAWEPKEKT